jgi:hypothetical protein
MSGHQYRHEDERDGLLRLNYERLTAPLIKVVQEFEADNNNLRVAQCGWWRMKVLGSTITYLPSGVIVRKRPTLILRNSGQRGNLLGV